MRAGTRSIAAGAVALAACAGMLAGCAPSGADSELLNPDVVPVNPELATLPDIAVVPDIPYGEHPLQRLDACLPPHEEEPPDIRRAAIIVVHGGSWARGDKADVAWRAVCQWLASAGYVALSVNYRLAPADRFPAAIEDVQAAVAWLREEEQVTRFRIDPARIGALGGSAGGNLVSLLGTAGSGDHVTGTRVAAVAELSGPIDLTGLAVTDDFVPVQLEYLGCDVLEECANAVLASPFYAIDGSDPPFFVAHSTDEKIPLAQAEILVAGLRAAGVPVEFVTVEGRRHSIAMLSAELKDRIVGFFDGAIGTPAPLGID